MMAEAYGVWRMEYGVWRLSRTLVKRWKGKIIMRYDCVE